MSNQPTNPRLYNEIKSKVKATVSKWPSAYASGMVIKQYKEAMQQRGLAPYANNKKDGNLSRWFKEDWVDIKTGKPCGSVKKGGYYPTCRPSKRISSQTPKTVHELSKSEKEKAIKEKQKVKGTKKIKF